MEKTSNSKRLERFIQYNNLALTGQLVSGIAHELNQPLTGIKGFAQAALQDLDKDNPVRKDLERIIEQANRIEEIIRSLRGFTGKPSSKTVKFGINQLINDSLVILNAQLKAHNIKVNKSLAENLPKIKGNANQLKQIFLNLIITLRDFIEASGGQNFRELIIESSKSQDGKFIELTFQAKNSSISQGLTFSILLPVHL